MSLQQPSQLTEELSALSSIRDMQLKLCQILNIHLSDNNENQLQFNLQGLNTLKITMRKIYNRLLVNSSPIQKVQSDNDKSDLFQEIEKKQAYELIQDLLQKQQSKNRCLLRKQFEFKEFQNSIVEQLHDEKTTNRKLKQQVNLLTNQLQQKTLQIMHLKNQVRALQRGNRDFLNQQKSEILTSRAYNISTLAYTHFQNERSREDKKMATSREKQYNKLNPKKTQDLKEKALYALYNNHKKNHSETINGHGNYDKTKKVSMTQKITGKKQLMKDLISIEYSNKKSIHARRKSEEFIKKTPSQREGRQSKQNKRKMDEIIEKLEF